jgi:hypothetical protein
MGYCRYHRSSKRGWLNTQNTSAGTKPDLPLEIAHLLLIDVVGYSKLLVNEQIELLQELNQIVRNTECFRSAEASGHPSLASLNSQSSSSIILFCARGWNAQSLGT